MLRVCQPGRHRAAFSLLELLIVLTIMAGLAAMAWPSLRRPMADSTVGQAANLLRDQIASCRQTASLSQQPILIRFDAGANRVTWGTWEQLLLEQLSHADSFSASSQTTQSSELQSWNLPFEIVIESVDFNPQAFDHSDTLVGNSLTDAPGNQMGLESDSSVQFRFGETPAADANTSGLPSSSLDQPANAEYQNRWYLPLLPNGQSRDAVIVLRDMVSGGRMAIELDSVTGMMKTSRLAAVNIAANPYDDQSLDDGLFDGSMTPSDGLETMPPSDFSPGAVERSPSR